MSDDNDMVLKLVIPTKSLMMPEKYSKGEALSRCSAGKWKRCEEPAKEHVRRHSLLSRVDDLFLPQATFGTT